MARFSTGLCRGLKAALCSTTALIMMGQVVAWADPLAITDPIVVDGSGDGRSFYEMLVQSGANPLLFGGAGSLTLTDTSELLYGHTHVYGYISSEPFLTVSGMGAHLLLLEQLVAGQGIDHENDHASEHAGYGRITVSDGGRISVATSGELLNAVSAELSPDEYASSLGDGGVTRLVLGDTYSSTGEMTLSGGSSTAVVGHSIVGKNGRGSLTILEESTYHTSSLEIGIRGADNAFVKVDGAGSILDANQGTISIGTDVPQNSGAIYNGVVKTSVLAVSNGAVIKADKIRLGTFVGEEDAYQGHFSYLVIGGFETSLEMPSSFGSGLSNPTAPGYIETSEIVSSGFNSIVFNHTSDAYVFDTPLNGQVVDVLANNGMTIFTGPLSANTRLGVLSNAALTGQSVAAVQVANDGIVSGNGEVNELTVFSEGILSPGYSAPVASVLAERYPELSNSAFGIFEAGRTSISDGGTYVVDVDNEGNSDQLRTGDLVMGLETSLRVRAANRTDDGSTYQPETTYTIIEFTGTRYNEFSSIEEDFAFLDASVAYTDTQVNLTLTRNDTSVADVALTRNQESVAGGLDGSETPEEIEQAMMGQSEDGARNALDQLGGEGQSNFGSSLGNNAGVVRGIVSNRMRGATGGVAAGNRISAVNGYGQALSDTSAIDGPVLWGEAFGSFAEVSRAGYAAVDHTHGGVITGADMRAGGDWRLGLSAGGGAGSISTPSLGTSISVNSYYLGAYGANQFGNLGIRLGAGLTWHDSDSTRNVAFGGFTDRLTAEYGATTMQVYGEAGYRLDGAMGSLEPFAGIAHVSQEVDGYTEEGGAAALTAAKSDQDTTFTTVGLRGETYLDAAGAGTKLFGIVAWQHAFGDINPEAVYSLNGGAQFGVVGTALDEDVALLEAGMSMDITSGTSLSVSYTGAYGEGLSQHGGTATFSVRY